MLRYWDDNLIGNDTDNDAVDIEEIFSNIATYLFSYPKIYLFQLFPPTETELLSIFYWHQKYLLQNTALRKQTFTFIANPLILIRYLAAKRLLISLPEAARIIAENDTQSDQLMIYQELQASLFNQLSLSLNNTFLMNDKINYIRQVNYKQSISDQEPYSRLRDILFCIANGDIHTIEQFFQLIAQVYLGSFFLKMLDKKTPRLTIIYCKNKDFITRLLKNIFSYPLHSASPVSLQANELCFPANLPHITHYSLKQLSNPNMFTKFIIDKIQGNIVNIDSTESSFFDIGVFKNLIADKKFSLIKDPLLGKIYHQSTSQYIYITENLAQTKSIFSDFDYNLIEFSGNIVTSPYIPLAGYESLFMILTSVYRIIDDDIKQDCLPKSKLYKSSSEDVIEKFLTDCCINTTNQIAQEDIEKIPLDSIKSSSNDTYRKKLAKELNIDKLEYILKDDLYRAYTQWCSTTSVQVDNISDTDFTKMVLNKLHIIFYLKNDMAKSIYDKNIHKAKVFYGLSIKKDFFDSYLQKKSQEKATISQSELEDNFLSYLGNLIRKYVLTNDHCPDQ